MIPSLIVAPLRQSGSSAHIPAIRWLRPAAAFIIIALTATAQYVLVSNYEADEIQVWHLTSGAYAGTFVPAGGGGIDGPIHLVNGPDGNVYVGSRFTQDIRRFHPATGATLGVFAAPGTGAVTASAFTFGPDGHIYACSHFTSEILRFDGSTGAFLGAFVPTGGGGLNIPAGITFGPDGNLYVSSRLTHQIKRYHGTTGAFLDNFVAAGSGGLFEPCNLGFGPDGNLYVCGVFSDAVHRYDGTTGASVGTFVPPGTGGLSWPYDLAFMPDGSLCVTGWASQSVIRCDGVTGAFLNVVAAGNGLTRPTGLVPATAFVPAISWQFNQPAAWLDIDGLMGSAFAAPAPGGCAGTVHLGSANAGLPWLLVLTSPEGVVASGSGGTALPGGQILNVDVSAPSLAVLDGGPWIAPATALQALPYALPATAPPISAQMAVADPGQAAGVSLSACARIDPSSAGPVVLPGPTADDSAQEVFLSGFCAAGSLTFCGTAYTSFFVSSNGFVSFGAGSTDASPTVQEFASQMPRLAGAWTDLNPSLGGAITVAAAGPVVTVSYACLTNAVTCNPFTCVQGAVVMDLEFDLAAGSCAVRNYGVTTQPSGFAFPGPMLMGLSPGGGAADPGSQSFLSQWGLGPRSGPANAMVYEFNPFGPVPPGFAGLSFPNSDPSLWIVY